MKDDKAKAPLTGDETLDIFRKAAGVPKDDERQYEDDDPTVQAFARGAGLPAEEKESDR